MNRITPALHQLTRTGLSNAQNNFSKNSVLFKYIYFDSITSNCKFIHKRALHHSLRQLNRTEENVQLENNSTSFKDVVRNGPSLKDFIINSNEPIETDIQSDAIPYLQNMNGSDQKVFFEVHGCQMNVNDAEVAWSILKSHGYRKTDSIAQADIVLLVTCSIRENAEQKIWSQLKSLKSLRTKRKRFSLPPLKVGLLGCMAERLKEKILDKEQAVDVIAGPDSYKDLPRLLANADAETAINVMLSFDETYADVMPVRLNPDSTTAYVTIMRGCDNMCSYCIVPFTRGKERSRPIDSIIREVEQLSDQGIKEITLLGQNVNSYRDLSESQFCSGSTAETNLVSGFKTVYKKKKGGRRFVDLLDKVSLVDPNIRIRFTSPHPKDFPDEVLQLIADRPNICKSLHIPAQSGNSAVLERMRRGYTREAYLRLIDRIREILPSVCLTTDMICGFCGETEEEFQDTLTLLQIVKYNYAYLFAYSMREKTTAHRRYKDDVPHEVKIERIQKMAEVFRNEVEKLNKAQIGQVQLLHIDALSKRSENDLRGRNEGNLRVIIPTVAVPETRGAETLKEISVGDFIAARIIDGNSETLKGIPLYHSSVTNFIE